MTQSIISNFHFSYPNSSQIIINNLNLKLEANTEKPSRVALVASNGVGKTTILNQLWEASFGKSSVNLAEKRLYFTQHIPNFEFNPQNFEENYFHLLLENYNSEDYTTPYWDWLVAQVSTTKNDFNFRFGSILLDFNIIPNQLPAHFSLLSPGTKKRFLLSLLLATQADLVLGDELTNHLDKGSVTVLTKYIQKSPASWLIVDHNQSFLSKIANKFIFIPDNQDRIPIHFTGTLDEFQEFLESMRDQQELEYKQVLSQKKQLQKRQVELQQLAKQFDESSQIGKMKNSVNAKLEKLETSPILSNRDSHKVVNFGKLKKQKIKQNLIIANTSDLIFQIGQNKTQTIQNFSLHHGQRLRITGPNGVGKSSLIKAIQIVLNQGDLQKYFSQYISGQFQIGSIQRDQIFALHQLQDYPKSQALDTYLKENTKLDPYTFEHFLHKLQLGKFNSNSKLDELSLGEFIRLQIGILSTQIQNIKLIILDEPGNYLDIYTQFSLTKMLENYSGAMLLITHDDTLAKQIGFDSEFEIGYRL